MGRDAPSLQVGWSGKCNVQIIQSWAKTFLLSSENHPQNVPQPTQKCNISGSYDQNLAGMFCTTLYKFKLFITRETLCAHTGCPIWSETLCLVECDLACSNACRVLHEETGTWQNWLGSWARCRNIQIKVDPTQVADRMEHPVEFIILIYRVTRQLESYILLTSN